MTLPQSDIKLQLAELATHAFDAFCQDISGMFGIDMACHPLQSSAETSKGLEKKFKKLSAIISVKARGVLEGCFHIVFDKEGLFTAAGTIVMLPDQRIQSLRKIGAVKDAEELSDAVGETGNLLVGSWDRIFREELEGHLHFLQSGTFLGNPWVDSQKSLGLPGDEEFLFLPYEMTIGSYPAFTCGVLFPEAVLHPAPPVQPPAPAEAVSVQVPPPAPVAEAVIAESAAEAVAKPVAEAVAAPTAPSPAAPLEETPAVGSLISQTIQKMVQSPPILPGEQTAFLKLCAKDVMQTQVLWGAGDDSVEQAMGKMQQADVGCMLVGTGGVPEGIVTWIDIAEAVSVYLRPAFARWRRPADDATLHIKLKIIMSRPVRTLSPDALLPVVMQEMCRHRLRCLPIVDATGKVQGVITAFDLFKSLLNTGADSSAAGQTPQAALPK